MFKATINLTGDSKLLKAYMAALSPEQNFKTERGSYALKLDKKSLKIEVKAKDATALRAILNSLTGLMTIVDKSIGVVNYANC